jgi:hypothetical protein
VNLPGVSVLDVAFVLSVAGVAALTGNSLGAGLALIVAATYFIATAILADRRSEPAK